jgi:2-polyprenyl-3-methyl-5-hydroxy-6-metoxy-1,4-benzoquinol methylase
MNNYQHLAGVYEAGGWDRFSGQYVGFINRLFEEYGIKHARILDVACGTGSLALALAKQGHQVHGIDISPEMIALASEKASAAAELSFAVQNMIDFEVEGEFDLVTCTFDAINYLVTADELKKMFDCAAQSLRKSGLFVFDSNTHRHYLSVGNLTQEHKIGAESFRQEVSYDPVRREATTIFRFEDGAVETHRQKPWELSELNLVLENSGLGVIKSFSRFDNSPFDRESKRLICAALRQ